MSYHRPPALGGHTGPDHQALEMQRRYSQHFTDSPDNSTPTSAHTRYSSADLYALNSGQDAPSQRNSGSALLDRRQGTGTWAESDSDEDEEDDGPGFGNYAAEDGQRARRSSTNLNLQQQPQAKRGSSRMSTMAPPLISSPSSQSYLPAHQPFTHASHPSQASLTPYGLPYAAVPSGLPSATSFGKPATPGLEVDAPILSKDDWNRGEAIREKHTHEKGKTRERKDEFVGEIAGGWGWVRRRWRWTVPLALFVIVATILLCYFLIPRTPTITFTSPKVPETPFTAGDDSGNPYISSADPTAFSFDARLTFAIDASASYLPVKYSSFGLTVKLSDTGGTVAHTVWDDGEITVPARGVTSYEFPITFQGNYTDDNDRTYQSMRSACAHKYATVYRPPLNLTVSVDASITGVVNAPVRTATLRGIDCPVEWPANAS
ncbi:hypothetical protein JCM10207_004828 [Rhodosporidiobolus poonsookiae]